MTAIITETFRSNLKRHLRSPALWFVGLAAPIAAVYMVPANDASYSPLTVNNAVPDLTSPVIGLQLGVIAATLLTPLAYIFLRAGATRHRPWQTIDVSPAAKPQIALGRWAADVGTLWIILAALTLAGIVLSYFRLEGQGWNPATLTLALWLPAAPALALIAAIRTLFDSRPWLRRWPGDVLFVVFWLGAMITPLAGSAIDSGEFASNAMTDAFGFIAPIYNATDAPITQVAIGGAPNTTERMTLDALTGVTNGAYMGARMVWLGMAALLAVVSGLVYKTRLNSRKMPKALKGRASRSITMATLPAARYQPMVNTRKRAAPLQTFLSNIRLILRGKVWPGLALLAALAGAALPYVSLVAPAIWLALLFPVTAEAGRWHAKTSRKFMDTLGPSGLARAAALLAASIAVFAAAHIPAFGQMVATGDFSNIPLMAKIIIGVPALAVGLGWLTKSAVAGRLILLLIWYAFLSSAGGMP